MLPENLKAFIERPFASPLLCFGAGALGALSMAPASFWPVLFVSLPLLYLCLSLAQTKRSAFVCGWLFGFGYFVFSLSWIGNALLIDGNPYMWAWPLAVTGLPALLASFPALSALLIHCSCDLRKISGFIGFVGFIFASELARGHLFTGFPWNLFGYTWIDILEVVQIASLGTVYALSALTIFWAGALGFVLVSPSKISKAVICALAVMSFAGNYAFGYWQLSKPEPKTFENIQFKIVQPNIPQAEKWQRDKMYAHFASLIEMSRNHEQVPEEKVTYIVWPETAINDWFMHDPGMMGSIRAMLHSYPGGAVLFTGALLADRENKTYSNSIIMVTADGQVLNIYNKHHLVPFGEYIPFQKWIPLQPIVQFTGFQAGDGLQTHETPQGLRYSPLICYEIIFPGRSVEAGSGPDFILNVTNDAWYGDSAGPYQHFAQARMRAIETSTPVLRAANTGISSIISAKGLIFRQTDLLQKETLIYNQTHGFRQQKP